MSCSAKDKLGPTIAHEVGQLLTQTQQALVSDTISVTGHTKWSDVRIPHERLTTEVLPSTPREYEAGGLVDDILAANTQNDGMISSPLSYAAIAIRSYHPGGTTAAQPDTSVQCIANQSDYSGWHSLSAREFAEAVNVEL